MSAVDVQAGRRPSARVGAVVIDVWRGAVADRIATGRLREVDWPYGLRAVVIVACALSVLAGVIAAASSLLRQVSVLTVDSSLASSTPEGLIWVMIALVTAVLAVLHLAAIHGPWWLKTLGIVFTVGLLGIWGVRGASVGQSGWLTLIVVALAVAVVVLSLVRLRKPFAWWEYPAFLGLIGTAVAVSVAAMGLSSRALGFELAPVLLQETVAVFGVLVLPMAIAAGTSVAEVTVGATLVATRRLERTARGWWPYALLGTVVAFRGIQSALEVRGRDPIRQGWLSVAPALAVAAVLGAVCWVLLRRARRSGDPVSVQQLPEELGRVSLPIGAVLVGILVPLNLALLAVQIMVAFDPTGAATRIPTNLSVVSDRGVDIIRGGLGLVLIALGFRRAGQGRGEVAVLFGAIGVVLVGFTMRALTANRWAIWLDPDTLNLIATGVAVLLLAWYLLRRRLTRLRALAGASLLILSGLFSSRDFVSDPVGSLLGYTGVALVLFGVAWDFLTSSEWGNGDSRRFRRPTRVLLVLSNTLLILVVLSYSALVRDADSAVDLDTFAELGNLVLGTGLLAAAFVAVVRTAADDRVVS